jgi:hypothetical protein
MMRIQTMTMSCDPTIDGLISRHHRLGTPKCGRNLERKLALVLDGLDLSAAERHLSPRYSYVLPPALTREDKSDDERSPNGELSKYAQDEDMPTQVASVLS